MNSWWTLPAKLHVHGFSGRKQEILRRFAGDSELVPVATTAHLVSGDTLVLWGSASLPPGTAGGVRVIRVEDGFIRSVGLGADLTKPLSWVMDHTGIYYDATRPSDLEMILAGAEFSPELVDRARRLQERIIAAGITKYNVGTGDWQAPQGRHCILVSGQVETDVSIKFGAPGIATNMGLLQAVRQSHPDAYIVYKPHPDVVAGLRLQGQGETSALTWADEVVTDAPMEKMLAQVNAVHVLTSQTGFEALMRGVAVTCHGQPFYAGWGLTTDVLPVLRRVRKLTVAELVAGALILYPAYVSRHSGQRISAEQALEELQAWRKERQLIPVWGRELMRKVLRLVVGVK